MRFPEFVDAAREPLGRGVMIRIHDQRLIELEELFQRAEERTDALWLLFALVCHQAPRDEREHRAVGTEIPLLIQPDPLVGQSNMEAQFEILCLIGRLADAQEIAPLCMFDAIQPPWFCQYRPQLIEFQKVPIELVDERGEGLADDGGQRGKISAILFAETKKLQPPLNLIGGDIKMPDLTLLAGWATAFGSGLVRHSELYGRPRWSVLRPPSWSFGAME
jgi:hypothetical protein